MALLPARLVWDENASEKRTDQRQDRCWRRYIDTVQMAVVGRSGRSVMVDRESAAGACRKQLLCRFDILMDYLETFIKG